MKSAYNKINSLFLFFVVMHFLNACANQVDETAEDAIQEDKSDSDSEESNVKASIGESCESELDCAASNAFCTDSFGDGINRCQSRCLSDRDCGDDDTLCLFHYVGEDVDEVGRCYRTCETPEDCGNPQEFRCEEYVDDDTTRFCLPACRLSECSADEFTYNCTYPSSYSEDNYTFSGSAWTWTVKYENGHEVACQGNGDSGTCNDDTGSSCSF